MKLYTRTGDEGQTGLIGGQRLSKAAPRIECYGTVDELNAHIGMAVVGADPEMAERLRVVQHELFTLGSHLAAPAEQREAFNLPPLSDDTTDRLEREMDEAETALPALREFILPGGCDTSARLHVARTVCRRAERLLVHLRESAEIEPVTLRYLNRLGDWLFSQARLANRVAGVADTTWKKP